MIGTQSDTGLAPLAELVDAPDSKSGSFGSAGSIPAGGTISSGLNCCRYAPEWFEACLPPAQVTSYFSVTVSKAREALVW